MMTGTQELWTPPGNQRIQPPKSYLDKLSAFMVQHTENSFKFWGKGPSQSHMKVKLEKMETCPVRCGILGKMLRLHWYVDIVISEFLLSLIP